MKILSITVYIVLLTNKIYGQLFDAFQGIQPLLSTLTESRQINYETNNKNTDNNDYNNNSNKNNFNHDFISESQIIEKNEYKTNGNTNGNTNISNPKDLTYETIKNDDNYTSQDEINDRNKSNNNKNDEFEHKFFGFNLRPIIDTFTRPPKRTVQRRPTQNNNNYRKSTNDRTTKAPDYYSIITQTPKTTTVYEDNNRFNNDYTTQRPNNMRKQQRQQNDYYEPRPIYSDSRPEYPQDNRYTTKRPYYNRPGIKPIYTQGPPITNRPKTTRTPQWYTKGPTFVNEYENNYQQTTHRPNNNNYNQRPTTTTEYNNYNKPTTQRTSYGNVNEGQYSNDRPYTEQNYNRPAQTRPQNNNNNNNNRPSYGNDGVIQFPVENDGDPELIDWVGPRAETMTQVQKRRYMQLAEKKCQEYKQLTTKKVQAIPLLPSPEPVQVNVSECVPSNVPLIIGGKTVPIAQFPHMAALGWMDLQTNGYSWKCGGSLLSEIYVLTAAHCAYQDRDNSVSLGPPQAVQLGSSYLDDPGALVVKVAAAMRHPKYELPKSYYDVALIKLARKVSFSAMIKPACLGAPPDPDFPVIATGWGKTENSYDTSPQLRGVSITIWDIGECYRVLGTSKKIPSGPLEGVQLCAGEREGGKDTCQGDSGGPIQIQDGCIWRICGITSFGRLCGAAHTPGVYATVDIPFIAAAVFSN